MAAVDATEVVQHALWGIKAPLEELGHAHTRIDANSSHFISDTALAALFQRAGIEGEGTIALTRDAEGRVVLGVAEHSDWDYDTERFRVAEVVRPLYRLLPVEDDEEGHPVAERSQGNAKLPANSGEQEHPTMWKVLGQSEWTYYEADQMERLVADLTGYAVHHAYHQSTAGTFHWRRRRLRSWLLRGREDSYESEREVLFPGSACGAPKCYALIRGEWVEVGWQLVEPTVLLEAAPSDSSEEAPRG